MGCRAKIKMIKCFNLAKFRIPQAAVDVLFIYRVYQMTSVCAAAVRFNGRKPNARQHFL